MTEPKQITLHEEADIHLAHFDLFDGLQFAEQNSLNEVDSFDDVVEFGSYLQIMDYIVIRVKSTDYPRIERTVI